MPTDTIFGTLCKTGFGLKELSERLLTIFFVTMQVDGTPSAIFAIKQLVRTLQLVIVILRTTTIGATPVLDDIPVGTLATIASGDGTLVATSGIETTDDIATFLSKFLG